MIVNPVILNERIQQSARISSNRREKVKTIRKIESIEALLFIIIVSYYFLLRGWRPISVEYYIAGALMGLGLALIIKLEWKLRKKLPKFPE